VAASVSAGLPVPLELEGQSVELAPEEILVSTLPVEGLAVAADKLLTVAVDATVTPELRAEGLAREVVAGCRPCARTLISILTTASQRITRRETSWQAFCKPGATISRRKL